MKRKEAERDWGKVVQGRRTREERSSVIKGKKGGETSGGQGSGTEALISGPGVRFHSGLIISRHRPGQSVHGSALLHLI